MNVFWREMKANRRSLIWWCVGMLFIIYAGMAKYAAYATSGQNISDMMKQLPPSLSAALGFAGLDVMKASGFYGMLYLYVLLMVTIHAALLGANILAKEERDRTSEFLLVKPASRTRIVTAKLGAAVANALVLNLVCLGLSFAVVAQYAAGEDMTGEILLFMGAMFIVQLLFLFLGSAIAAVGKRPRIAATIATSVMLTTYVISIVVDINKNLDFLRYLTPFKYFAAAPVLDRMGYEPIYVVLSAAIIVASVVVTYVAYNRRDMKL